MAGSHLPLRAQPLPMNPDSHDPPGSRDPSGSRVPSARRDAGAPPRAFAPLAWELLAAPLLWAQGRRVRRVTPRLPEAAGPREGQAVPPACHAAAVRPLRLLIAGDSAAAGVGVGRIDQAMAGRLPGLLAAQLRCPVAWRLIAANGLDARSLLPRLDDAPAGLDLALVAVGVNDATGRRSPARWLDDLVRLRDRLRDGSPGVRLLWSGLPPMHAFPALPRPLRDYLGERSRGLDAALAAWVAGDPTMHHLPLPDLRGDGMMASDGFHPGPAGHRLWADLLAPAAAGILATAR